MSTKTRSALAVVALSASLLAVGPAASADPPPVDQTCTTTTQSDQIAALRQQLALTGAALKVEHRDLKQARRTDNRLERRLDAKDRTIRRLRAALTKQAG